MDSNVTNETQESLSTSDETNGLVMESNGAEIPSSSVDETNEEIIVLDSTDNETEVPSTSRMMKEDSKRQRRVFIMSGFQDVNIKFELDRKVKRLGGISKYMEDMYVNDFTHVIVPNNWNPSSNWNSKWTSIVTGAIGSGKQVVIENYIQVSYKAKKFVNEDPYVPAPIRPFQKEFLENEKKFQNHNVAVLLGNVRKQMELKNMIRDAGANLFNWSCRDLALKRDLDILKVDTIYTDVSELIMNDPDFKKFVARRKELDKPVVMKSYMVIFKVLTTCYPDEKMRATIDRIYDINVEEPQKQSVNIDKIHPPKLRRNFKVTADHKRILLPVRRKKQEPQEIVIGDSSSESDNDEIEIIGMKAGSHTIINLSSSDDDDEVQDKGAEKKQKEENFKKMEQQQPPSTDAGKQPQMQNAQNYKRPDPTSPPPKRPRFYDFGNYVMSSPGSDSTITEEQIISDSANNGSLDVNITNETDDAEMAPGISEPIQIDQPLLSRYFKAYQCYHRENFKGFDTGDVKIKSLYFDSNKESHEKTSDNNNKDNLLEEEFKKDDLKEPISVVWREEDLKAVLLFHDSKEDSHWDYLTDIHACSALISSRHLIPVQYLVHLLCLLDNWNGSKESLNLAIHSYLELLNNGYHAPNDIEKRNYYRELFREFKKATITDTRDDRFDAVAIIQERLEILLKKDETFELQRGIIEFCVTVLEMDFTYWWKYGELSKENNKYHGKSKTNPPLVASISTDGTRTLAKLLNFTRIAGNLEMTILILKLYSMVSTYVSYTKDVENWPTLSQINSHKYELASNLLEVEKFKSVKKTSIMANLIRPSWLSGLFLCQVVNKEKDLQFKDDEDKAVNNLSNTQLENIWQRILPQPELTLANLKRLDVSLYLCMTSKIINAVAIHDIARLVLVNQFGAKTNDGTRLCASKNLQKALKELETKKYNKFHEVFVFENDVGLKGDDLKPLIESCIQLMKNMKLSSSVPESLWQFC